MISLSASGRITSKLATYILLYQFPFTGLHLNYFRSVLMIATSTDDNTGTVTVQRRQKGSAEKLGISCPKIVSNYNKGMGGVDLLDQRKSYYEVDRKAKFRFYLRIFFDLMDIACVNALIVYQQCCNSKICLLDFKKSVADSMTRKFSSRKRSFPFVRPNRLSSLLRPRNSPASIDHMPIFKEKRRRCCLCARLDAESKKTSIECSTCEVPLCLQKERNCFLRYHTE